MDQAAIINETAWVAISFVIFIVLMGVPLPRGSGMFRAFNSLLY